MLKNIIIVVVVWLIVGFIITMLQEKKEDEHTGGKTSGGNRRSGGSGNAHTGSRRPVTRDQINALYNAQDRRTQSDSRQREVVTVVKRYQNANTKSVQGGTEQIRLDLSWSENLEELIDATGVLYSNGQMTSNSRMESARFEYYKNLHYRSFTAADLCQSKIEEMRPAYDHINKVIMRLNDRSDSLRVDTQTYREIVQIKDNMKAIIAFLSARRDALNAQTRTLRGKIGKECGRGGAEWEARILAKHSA